MKNAINQFKQAVELGQLDLAMSINTIAAQVDVTQATPIVPGTALKIVDGVGGLPKVVACTADSDLVFGFANYSAKDVSYSAGDVLEMSLAQNVMWLQARGAIVCGARVCLDAGVAGEVQALTTGAAIVGVALDKASNGQMLRVLLGVPTFQVAP